MNNSELPDNIEEQLRTAANDFFKDELDELVAQRDSVKDLITQLRTNLEFLKQVVPNNNTETNAEEALTEDVAAEETEAVVEEAEVAQEETPSDSEEVVSEEAEVQESIDTSEEEAVAQEVTEELTEEDIAPVAIPSETPESLGLTRQTFDPEENVAKDSEALTDQGTDTVTELDDDNNETTKTEE